jgi:hypothetical protein
VCPADWTEGGKTIRGDPIAKLDYFAAVDGQHENGKMLAYSHYIFYLPSCLHINNHVDLEQFRAFRGDEVPKSGLQNQHCSLVLQVE